MVALKGTQVLVCVHVASFMEEALATVSTRNTGGHAEGRGISWETAGGTALSPTCVTLPVTAGDTGGSAPCLWGHTAPCCHHGDISECERCCCIPQSWSGSSYSGETEAWERHDMKVHLRTQLPAAAEGQFNENTDK